ncbi:5-hydroxytryptamine receptor 3A-like [Acanthochromis polyacanthus]|uniref:5-hydroxytryptamine receptor 3A-like n=1 Tax=Acanthochromis polyacanthus TaxID=80966 RepID=UPI0022347A2D|nr:5-hydroxytryptamine receptor 3A-like [Acanthochromis polyacanthus]
MLGRNLKKRKTRTVKSKVAHNCYCKSRRCLAQKLIDKEYVSQPQEDNCTKLIAVPFLEYQTLSVMWTDPELAWNTSDYPVDEVILPVKKIWTPEIHVTNGIVATMQHNSHDLLVYSNGTVKHSVIINAEVNCEVNLFNYPFAADECPVAIQAWSTDGCGTKLALGRLMMVDGAHGDWQTDYVNFDKKRDDRNYIMVSLRIKPANPFITLLLPSMLIILADMVSFALPLTGGERNSFKVTLVLSFTMFLNILNDQLPGDSSCSPVIRTHFCICLIILVVSMLVSLVLTRAAQDGGLILCCCSKRPGTKNTRSKEQKQSEEVKTDISVIQMDASGESTQLLGKVVKFLEALDAKDEENEKRQWTVNLLDKIFFWFYFILGTAYFCAMTIVMAKYRCNVDHFDFWYEEIY